MKTLAIHLYDPSTEELKLVYEGCSALGDIERVDHYIPKKELAKKIDEADLIIMLGHGGPGGLMNVDHSRYKRVPGDNDSYMVDASLVPNLRGKDIVTVWCFAKQFAIKNHLNGFWTDMWVSEESEASWQNIHGFKQKYIRKECAKLSFRLRKLLEQHVPISEFPQRLNDMAKAECENGNLNQLLQFNYGNVDYFSTDQDWSSYEKPTNIGYRGEAPSILTGQHADSVSAKKSTFNNPSINTGNGTVTQGKKGTFDVYTFPQLPNKK